MKRGLIVSAVVLAMVLVSLSTFVSAQAALSYGARPGAIFNPDQDMARLTIQKPTMPSPAPVPQLISANVEDSREINCQTFEDTGIPYCAIEGFAPFAFTPGTAITINAANNQLIISAPKDKSITYAFNEGGAFVLSPGQSMPIKELPSLREGMGIWINEVLGGRHQYRTRTPTAVAAVRGSDDPPEEEDLAAAPPVDSRTIGEIVSDLIENIISSTSGRIIKMRTGETTITPTAVAAVRGSQDLSEKSSIAAN